MATQEDLQDTHWTQWALLGAAVVAVGLVMMLAITPIAPDVYWDIRPQPGTEAPVTALGPAPMAWINLAAVLVTAAGLLVHVLAGGRVRWLSIGAAAVAAVVCCVHAVEHYENLLKCTHWVAGLSLAVLALHLAERENIRRLFVAAMIGVLPFMMLSSLGYVLIEHSGNIESFLATEEEMLKLHGWDRGSPQHLLFIRRMSGGDAFGAFGLANVYASVVLSLTMVAVGVAVARGKAWLSPRTLLPAGLALCGVVTLALTRSKGAVVALVVVIGLLAVWQVAKRSRLIARGLPVVALLAVACALAAVFARASLGPPDSIEGERSLLFRYHYFVGAARAWSNAPDAADQVLGLGPHGLRVEYPRYKPAINPEEITSTHNVFVDELVMLGTGGALWALMLLAWLARAAWTARPSVASTTQPASDNGDATGVPSPDGESPRTDPEPPAHEEPVAPIDTMHVAAAVVVTAIAWLGNATVLGATFGLISRFVAWSLGGIAMIGTTASLSEKRWLSSRGASLGLFLGGAALLVHNQIEMTFFADGASMLAMFMLGAAAAIPHEDDAPAATGTSLAPKRILALSAPLAVAVLAGWLMISATVPITQHQAAMRDAADSVRAGNNGRAYDRLDDAINALPIDPEPYGLRVRLLIDRAMAEPDPRNVRQFANAVDDQLARAEATGLDVVGFARTEAQFNRLMFDRLGDIDRLKASRDAWQRAIEYQPFDVHTRLQLADVLFRLGEAAAAHAAYEKTLELHENMYLDPAKQLTVEQLRHVKAQIEWQSGDGDAESR